LSPGFQAGHPFNVTTGLDYMKFAWCVGTLFTFFLEKKVTKKIKAVGKKLKIWLPG